MEFLSQLFGWSKKGKDSLPPPPLDSSALEQHRATIFGCDGCKKRMNNDEPRYHCSECPNFDLCDSCFTKEDHPHYMSKETGDPNLVARNVQNSEHLFEAFNYVFDALGTRRGFGKIVITEGGELTISWKTFKQVRRAVLRFAFGLRQLELKPGDFVGLCSNNRLEWLIADLACIFNGYVVVPIHHVLDEDNLGYISSDAGCKVIICSGDLVTKYQSIAKHKDSKLRFLISMDNLENESAFEEQFNDVSCKLLTMKTMSKKGKSDAKKIGSSDLYHRAEPDTMETLIYTSGSTGRPKGIIHTRFTWHHALVRNFTPRYSTLVVDISFAPLAHTTPRRALHLDILRTGACVFAREDLKYIFEDMKLVRPTIVSASPRLWNVIYSEYKKALALAIDANKKLEAPQPEGVIEKEVLKSFKGVLGTRVDVIITGGAPTSPAVLDFLKSCFAVWVEEGYGTSETAAISGENHVAAGVQLKLIDVPELGYYTTDDPPRGEILVKSEVMCKGYWNQKELTEETFKDGWFHTGDIGERNAKGKIKIIDRRKNFFKLAQGEFVAPEGVEKVFVESPYVHQVFVYGEGLWQSLGAVVVPNTEVCINAIRDKRSNDSHQPATHAKKKRKTNLAQTYSHDAATNNEIEQLILDDLKRLGSGKLQPYEIPRFVHIFDEEFSMHNELLTATLKNCRPKLKEKFKHVLNKRYREMEALSTQRRLQQILSQTMGLSDEGDGTLAATSSFVEMGGDSLVAVKLVETMRAQFKVDVPVNVIYSSPNIQETLEKYISEAKTSTATLQLAAEVDFAFEATLPDDLRKMACPFDCSSASHDNILVTGVTGFLGLHLLKALLRKFPNATLNVLIRGSSESDALDRLKTKFVEYDIKFRKSYSKRIKTVLGDLSKPQLGLNNDEWKSLCSEITCIYHSGAWVNGLFDYRALKAANVGGTIEILRLAVQDKIKSLHYVSTISVIKDRDAAKEEPLDVKSLPWGMGGYPQSKWVAEMLVQQMADKGFPITISRPATICASTETHKANWDDFTHRVLLAILTMRKCPAELLDTNSNRQRMNWIPVDTCCDFIISSMIHLETQRGKVMHLVNINGPTSWDTLIEAAKAAGIDVIRLEWKAWRDEVIGSKRNESPIAAIQPYFAGPQFPKMGGRFESNEMKMLMKIDDSLRFPALTVDLLTRIMQRKMN